MDNSSIDNAIKAVTVKITTGQVQAHEAMQLAQAALSLAHAKQVLSQIA